MDSRRTDHLVKTLYLILLTTASLLADSVNLTWSPSPDPRATGYVLCQGPTSRNYNQTVDVGTNCTAVATNLVTGQKYYWAVYAYGYEGTNWIESIYSNEVSWPSQGVPLRVHNLRIIHR
jgi:hypothetical protein